MYHAAIITLSNMEIDTPAARVRKRRAGHGGPFVGEVIIYIQYPDESVARRLGESFASRRVSEHADAKIVFDDAEKAAGELDEIKRVGWIGDYLTTTYIGNGEPTKAVDEIEADFDWGKRRGTIESTTNYILTITLPYNEDRYGDLYTFGMSVGPKPARTNACVTCGHDQPKFVCAGCDVQRYCSDACYRLGWNLGDHTPSCQSQQHPKVLTGAPPEDRRRRKPEAPEGGAEEPSGEVEEPELKRARTGFERDDAGLTGDAETGEPAAESHVLQLLTEQQGDHNAGMQLLLRLEPSLVSNLCRTSAFYLRICQDPTFQQLYRNRWFVNVAVKDLMGATYSYELLRTRQADQVKTLYERDTGLDRMSYNMLFGGRLVTKQSVLEGMITPGPEELADNLVFHVTLRLPGPATKVRVLRHWFANGTTLDVSQ